MNMRHVAHRQIPIYGECLMFIYFLPVASGMGDVFVQDRGVRHANTSVHVTRSHTHRPGEGTNLGQNTQSYSIPHTEKGSV